VAGRDFVDKWNVNVVAEWSDSVVKTRYSREQTGECGRAGRADARVRQSSGADAKVWSRR